MLLNSKPQYNISNTVRLLYSHNKMLEGNLCYLVISVSWLVHEFRGVCSGGDGVDG